MATTVRINRGWALATTTKHGGVAPLAEKLNLDRSTVYRQLSGTTEAGPRFIAAVLTALPVRFDDAFDVVDLSEEVTA